MKKSITIVHGLVLLFVYQLAFAVTGALFRVSASGNQTTDPINISLCLNGKGPLSCQSHTISQPRLTIRTTIPGQTYVAAGIKISSTKVKVTNLEGCVPNSNGFCLFSVSDSQAANIFINNPTATPIVFLSLTTTSGDMSSNSQNLTGPAGANAICNYDAQTYGTSAVKAHTNYIALLITSSLTPCSEKDGIKGCAGPYASPLWPLKPGTTYYNPDGVTPFNTVTSNAIFPDTSPQDSPYPDLTYPDGGTPQAGTSFWFGPQSIYINEDLTAIMGWAYGNLAHSMDYSANLQLCIENGEEWTSPSGSSFGAYGQTATSYHCGATPPCGTPNTWQNYYGPEIGDTFSASNYIQCTTHMSILCISSP